MAGRVGPILPANIAGVFNWRSVFASWGVARRVGQADQIRDCLRNRVADCWLPETSRVRGRLPAYGDGQGAKEQAKLREQYRDYGSVRCAVPGTRFRDVLLHRALSPGDNLTRTGAGR
jgi:hypothetical protein